MRRVASETPRSVWAATALFVLLGLWWSILSPPGVPPDENAHVDLVYHVADTASYPAYDGRARSVGASALAYGSGGIFFETVLRPDNATPRSDRPTITDLGGDRPISWPDPRTGEYEPLPNQMAQHPPLYYLVAAGVLRVARAIGGGEMPADREVLGLRLLGVAMVAHLPLCGWWAARRIGARRHACLAAAVAPLAMPQLQHVTASVSYVPMLVGVCALLAVFVAGIVKGDRRRSTAIAAGVLTGLALWTNASAVLLLPWVAAAYAWPLLRHRRDRERRWRSVRAAATYGATSVLVGAWWWVANLVREGTPTPSTDSDLYAALSPRPGFRPRLSLVLELTARWVPRRFLGEFGNYEARIGAAFVTVALVVVGVAAVAALVPDLRRRRSRGTAREGDAGADRTADPGGGRDRGVGSVTLLVYVSLLPELLAFVVWRSWDLYRSSGVVTFIQGRYLYGALVPLFVVVGVGLGRLLGRWSPLVLLAGGAALHAEGTRAVLDRWWGTPGSSLRWKVAAVGAWNPWFDQLPYVLLAALALAALAVAFTARPVRQP